MTSTDRLALVASLDALVVRRCDVVARTNTPATRLALLDAIGQSAEASRPAHPDAAVQSREYADALLATGQLDVVRERYARFGASLAS